MSYRLPALGTFRAFEAAARHLSFKKAASELNVTPAAISHQIKALEEQLGLELFVRLTRSLALTEAGRQMLPKVQEAFDCLQEAVALTQPQPESHTLTVSAPPSFAARWLMPRLQRFTARHPDIELRLSSGLNLIDTGESNAYGSDWLDNADGGTADVAIRCGLGRYPGCRVAHVFTPTYLPACQPALLKGPKPLRTPADLRHYTLIHDDTIPDAAERPSWEDWLREAGESKIDGTRGPRFADGGLALQAAMDGLGVVLALKPLIMQDVAAGRLVLPFELAIPLHFAYYLVSPDKIAQRPAVVAFYDWLLDEVEHEPVALPA
ncbi:LysR family transcriptional regulator [Chitinimonas naiadis]